MRGLFTSRILWDDNTYGSFVQDACSLDELECLRILRDYPTYSICTPHVYRWLALWSDNNLVIQKVGDLILRYPNKKEKVAEELEKNRDDDLFMSCMHLTRIYFDWKANIPEAFIAKRTFFWDLLNKKRRDMPRELPQCLSIVSGIVNGRLLGHIFTQSLIMYQCWSSVPDELRELLFCICIKFLWDQKPIRRTYQDPDVALSPHILDDCLTMDYDVVHYRTMERAMQSFWTHIQGRYTYAYGNYIPKSSKRLRASIITSLGVNTGRYNFVSYFMNWISTLYPDIPMSTDVAKIRLRCISFFVWARLLDSLGMIHLYNGETGYFHFERK